MIEIIMSIAGYAMIALFSIAIYFGIVSKILPELCVRWKKPSKKLGDRGIKKYRFPEGRGIVYEPELKVRKYIKQYTLLSYEGDKFLKCMLEPKIRLIKYDVIVYGPDDELLDIIAVTERVSIEGYSKAVLLPEDTSYVNIVLRAVDDMYRNSQKIITYSPISVALLSVFVAVATVFETYVIGIMINNILSILNIDGALYINNMRFLIHSIILGAICGALFALSYFIRTAKVVNK